VRIVAGQHRSRRLVTPPGKGVRPTSDRAREAIFASLGAAVIDARVLDLYAGSGALGLEALSRGASSCHFVERNAEALEAIRTNLETLGESAHARVERGNAMTVLQRLADAGEQFELVLVDPPYDAVPDLAAMLTTLLPRVLSPTGSIVFETAAGAAVPVPGLVERYNRRIAAAEIVILQHMETP
jgi:16S rRNA (guanine966-N2)-methyltransferase